MTTVDGPRHVAAFTAASLVVGALIVGTGPAFEIAFASTPHHGVVVQLHPDLRQRPHNMHVDPSSQSVVRASGVLTGQGRTARKR
jgi:hypothetical protein